MPHSPGTRTLESADQAHPPEPPSNAARAGDPSRIAGVAASEQDCVCPYFHQAVELVGKRWTGAIVGALLPGPRRFSEISQAIPQISDRLLSTRLRELEEQGVVARQVLNGAPVRVEYELTPKGHALEPAIAQLGMWAREWLKTR
jgi:DNA-binding HxlR family transcriptional regulator